MAQLSGGGLLTSFRERPRKTDDSCTLSGIGWLCFSFPFPCTASRVDPGWVFMWRYPEIGGQWCLSFVELKE